MFHCVVLIIAVLLYALNYGESSPKPELPSLNEGGTSKRIHVRKVEASASLAAVTNETEIPNLRGGNIWFADVVIGNQSVPMLVDTGTSFL